MPDEMTYASICAWDQRAPVACAGSGAGQPADPQAQAQTTTIKSMKRTKARSHGVNFPSTPRLISNRDASAELLAYITAQFTNRWTTNPGFAKEFRRSRREHLISRSRGTVWTSVLSA